MSVIPSPSRSPIPDDEKPNTSGGCKFCLKLPSVKSVFPSFEVYIVIIVTVGVPILIAIGYAHFKRTKAFKSEIDVMIESNPYQRRNTVNNEMNLRMNLQLIKLLTKLVNDDKLEPTDSENLKKLIKTYEEFTKTRTFTNNSDIDFIKKEIQNK